MKLLHLLVGASFVFSCVALGFVLLVLRPSNCEPMPPTRGYFTGETVAKIHAQPIIGPLKSRVVALCEVPDPTADEIEFLASVALSQDWKESIWPANCNRDHFLATRGWSLVALESLAFSDHGDRVVEVLRLAADDKFDHVREIATGIVAGLDEGESFYEPTPAAPK